MCSRPALRVWGHVLGPLVGLRLHIDDRLPDVLQAFHDERGSVADCDTTAINLAKRRYRFTLVVSERGRSVCGPVAIGISERDIPLPIGVGVYIPACDATVRTDP